MTVVVRSCIFLCSFVLLPFVSGCSTGQAVAPRSALQTRELQTREFSTKNERLVMKAVLNALQDDGYITKNAVTELGLLTATKESDTSNTSSMLLNSILMGSEARWQKTMVIEANANVSAFGDRTRVRVSFQRKVLDNTGAVMQVEEIFDPLFYQDFFRRVDQSIFIQGQRI